MSEQFDLADHPRLNALVMKHGRFPESIADVLTRFAEHFDRHDGEKGAGTRVPAQIAPKSHNGDTGTRRARPGTVTPAHKYKEPIIRVLMQVPNGFAGLPPYSMPAKKVIDQVWDLMKTELKETDLGRLSDTGLPRWENKCQWGRQLLVDEGLLKKREESGFGIWALSPKGIEYGKALSKQK